MNLVKIKGSDYGLEETQATELTKGLSTILEEREVLIEAYKDVVLLEISEENLSTFKALRLQIRDNRTKGIEKWHKTNKAYFLTGGRFVDAIKNKEVAENERMESKLIEAEKHFENLEKERISQIQSDRVALLSEFLEDAAERELASMEQDVWESYLSTKKKIYLDKIQAELDIEKERQAKIQAEKEEQERIRKENEVLRKEAEAKAKQDKIEANKRAKIESERIAKEEVERKERERLAKIEANKQADILRKEREAKEKVETQLKASKDAEEKAKQDAELTRQAELKKGDAAKLKDLISDLEAMKTKYSFKSAKNIKMYNNVNLLIDKTINFING